MNNNDLQGWWRLWDPNLFFHQEEIINHKHQKRCSNAEITQYLHLKRFDGANSPLHHLHLPRLSTEHLQDLFFSAMNLSEISLITEQGWVAWVQLTSQSFMLVALATNRPVDITGYLSFNDTLR